MEYYMVLQQDLREQIAKKQIVAVLGTGISKATSGGSDVADWVGLLKSGIRRCQEVIPGIHPEWGNRQTTLIASGEVNDLLSCAEEISTKLKKFGGEFDVWLRETVGSLVPVNPDIIYALAELGIPIITTNYDTLLEEVMDVPALTWNEPNKIQRWLRDDPSGIVHLHGVWSNPESVVLSIRDYERLRIQDHIQDLMKAVQFTRSFLFIGFGSGLNDPNFSALLKWRQRILGGSEYRSFRLALAKNLENTQQQHLPNENIHVLSYGTEYEHLATYLRSLGNRPIQPQSTRNNPQVTSVLSYTIQSLQVRYQNHNLPAKLFSNLVGRSRDLQSLLSKLSFRYHDRILYVSGIGGVGKTSLVLEAAYRCLGENEGNISASDIPFFDVIVFSSAQLTKLTSQGITSIPESDLHRPMRTLQDLCVDIANTLKKFGLKFTDPIDQISSLKAFLGSGTYRILIILDNFETLETSYTYEIINFLREIEGNYVKVLITTRISDTHHIHLKELPEEASLEIIHSLIGEKNCLVTTEFPRQLNEVCRGIPLAMNYAIGLLTLDNNCERVLAKINDHRNDLVRYCFDKLLEEIEQENPIAYEMLMTLIMSSHGLTQENLLLILNKRNFQLGDPHYYLRLLYRCSLIFEDQGFIKMLPLTRNYLLSKFEDHRNLEQEFRSNWVSHYIDIANRNGGEDQGEYHEKYDVIDREWKNFKEVFDWCHQKRKYIEAQNLWKHLCRFAYLYGYWSDRLNWSSYLMDMAIQKGDNAFLAELKSACAWLKLLREGEKNLLQAEILLNEAWTLQQACEPHIKKVIIINKAVLYTRMNRFDKAKFWFDKYLVICKEKPKDANLEKRLRIRFLLYWGESCYRQSKVEADLAKSSKLLKTAQKLNELVVKEANEINWLRLKVKAHERLACFALKAEDFDKAQEILHAWYPTATRNRDYRRMAFFERDFALLEIGRENYLEARNWAFQAAEKFKDLEMDGRYEDMQRLIVNCDVKLNLST